eukprot:2936576-Ditylum_brightwellii.AAC.1
MVKSQSSKAGKQPTNSGSPTKKSSSVRKMFFSTVGGKTNTNNHLFTKKVTLSIWVCYIVKRNTSNEEAFWNNFRLELEDENVLARSIYNVNAIVSWCLKAAQNTEMMSSCYPFYQMGHVTDDDDAQDDLQGC